MITKISYDRDLLGNDVRILLTGVLQACHDARFINSIEI